MSALGIDGPARTAKGLALGDRVLPAAGLTVEERIALEAAVPELKPRAREIADVALGLLDREGAEGLSMRRIASGLGVRAPSLYKHLPDKQAVVDIVVADILRAQGTALRRAIRGADDPLGALLGAFRAWALGHPERYALCMAGRLSDEPMVRAADLWAGDPIRWLMRDDLEGAVTVWAFAHGVVDLEIKGRIPPTYAAGLIWDRGVHRLRHPDDPAPRPERSATPSPDILVGPRTEADVVPLSTRATEIVTVARELLETEGPEGMSMRRIAERLGVRAPSLYKHLPDKRALENAILAVVLREQGTTTEALLHRAVADGTPPIEALMAEYRRWALEHPQVYRLNMSGPLDRGPQVRSAELWGSLQMLAAYHGDAVGGLTMWAFGHGMVDLELKGRFPPGYSLDGIWRRGLDVLGPPDDVAVRRPS